MRKIILSIVSVVAIAVLTGCGAPSWVKGGTGVYKGQASVGVYGVGEGISDLSPEAQANFASIKARSAVDKAETKYVMDLLKTFVKEHGDWFKTDQVSKLGLYSKAADAITSENLLNMEKVTQWTDTKGSVGDAGTLYMLRYLPLDSDFFDSLLKNYKKVIQDNADKILKVKADTVLKGLDNWVKRLQSDPLTTQLGSQAEKAHATTEATQKDAGKATKKSPK